MLVIIFVCLFTVFRSTGADLAAVETNSVIGNFSENVSTPLRKIEKEVETLVKSLTKTALPYFIRNSDSNVSSSCMSTLMQMFMDLRKLKLPVIKSKYILILFKKYLDKIKKNWKIFPALSWFLQKNRTKITAPEQWSSKIRTYAHIIPLQQYC